MKKIISILICLFVGVSVHAAGSAHNQTVTRVMMDLNYPDRAFIKLSGSASGTPPGCATHTVWDFVLDTSTQHGMLMFTMLMNAYNEGDSLTLVLGSGSCEQSTELLRRLE